MPTREINLTKHFHRFIETPIESGRFSNVSEVVHEGLRLLEQREKEDKAKIQKLRAAAKEGFDAFDRKDYTTLKSEKELDAFLDQLPKRYQPNSPLSGNVPKKPGVQFHVTGPARRDIAAILKRTLQEFGQAAKER